jgi:three-Cys-motif partner protein
MGQPVDTLWKSQPRTLLKHRVYRRYLHCWMGKICQKFRQSAIVDAFAGPGAYLDGPDGSPLVIAKTFLEHSRLPAFNLLRLICLEERPDRRESLETRLGSIAKVPKLDIKVLPPGRALQSFSALGIAARRGDPATPTLWILDPFDISSVPFALVRSCLAGARDELLITWFADEIYRFCQDRSKEAALDRHFGTDSWQKARQVRGESDRKESLLRAYRDSLESLGGVYTGAFSIASKNETARYSIVFATHSDKGLECFNQARWKMDPYRGHHASEQRSTGQLGLFDATPVISPLRAWLESCTGQAMSFEDLARHAGRLGFKESHLRSALSDMAAEGLAVRETPLDAHTPWPGNSMIHLYPPADGRAP